MKRLVHDQAAKQVGGRVRPPTQAQGDQAGPLAPQHLYEFRRLLLNGFRTSTRPAAKNETHVGRTPKVTGLWFSFNPSSQRASEVSAESRAWKRGQSWSPAGMCSALRCLRLLQVHPVCFGLSLLFRASQDYPVICSI